MRKWIKRGASSSRRLLGHSRFPRLPMDRPVVNPGLLHGGSLDDVTEGVLP
jgi:hypothetical protein